MSGYHRIFNLPQTSNFFSNQTTTKRIASITICQSTIPIMISAVLKRGIHTSLKTSAEVDKDFLNKILAKVTETTAKPTSKRPAKKRDNTYKADRNNNNNRTNNNNNNRTNNNNRKFNNNKPNSQKNGQQPNKRTAAPRSNNKSSRFAKDNMDVMDANHTTPGKFVGGGKKSASKPKNSRQGQRRVAAPPKMVAYSKPTQYTPETLTPQSLLRYSSVMPSTKDLRVLNYAMGGIPKDSEALSSIRFKGIVRGDYQVIDQSSSILSKNTAKLNFNFGVVKNLLNNNGSYDLVSKTKAFEPCVGVKSVKELINN
ncbi:hypothetical protein DASC09_048080 [Saccharomycopsis crataegensis]|uniref:Uncharacterized protein n=1 Tax=Saccharomycopsis crataegensis TaxID=43959 RepID=A0AAV5QTL6_9ASCO|nr:hypothetical protein DASC09_048080 [Saccharomycopsis crataegensis]